MRDGTVEVRHSAHHVYTVAEIGRMLAAAGLHTRAMYGALDRETFAAGSPRLLLIAEKNDG